MYSCSRIAGTARLYMYVGRFPKDAVVLAYNQAVVPSQTRVMTYFCATIEHAAHVRNLSSCSFRSGDGLTLMNSPGFWGRWRPKC